MPPTTAAPNILTDAGYLFIAPLATAEPTNTVAGGKFSDAWAAAWVSLGATEEGSTFTYQSNIEAISVAEFFDPIKYATTSRTGSFAFNLADYTLSNWNRALNGGPAALTPVSGTGVTALTSVTPKTPGTEVRVMLGWESLDNSVRVIVYQAVNGGEIAAAFRKAPDKALIPCTFNFEIPTSGNPWKMYAAGTARA